MAGATLDGADDDGYVSPEFDLPSEDEAPAPAKRPKRHAEPELHAGDGLADEEELALALLRRRR
jgi:ATP-dependent RNA helicase DDX10/DBP4